MEDDKAASNSGKNFWLIAYKSETELTKHCFQMGLNSKTKLHDVVEVYDCVSWSSFGGQRMALLHVKPQKRASQIRKIMQERCTMKLRSLLIESKQGTESVAFCNCPTRLPLKATVKSPILMEQVECGQEDEEPSEEEEEDEALVQVR
jgi:hypothetical protein